MLTIGTTVLGVRDVPRATAFWTAALKYAPREPPDDDTFVVLVPRDGVGPGLALAYSETPTQTHPRVHIDLYADDQSAEVDRLVGLGARRADWDSYPADADYVVLADPDDNVFCVIDKS